MAYSYTVTGPVQAATGDYVVRIAETEAAATSEWEVTGLPQGGRIVRAKVSLVSGSGTTVDPIMGTETDPDGVSVVLENGTAAADVDLQPVGGACYMLVDGTLYGRSVVDAGADNVVSTEILVRRGWAG